MRVADPPPHNKGKPTMSDDNLVAPALRGLADQCPTGWTDPARQASDPPMPPSQPPQEVPDPDAPVPREEPPSPIPVPRELPPEPLRA